MSKNFDLATHIPQKAILACSGGVDSMAALSFLLNGRRDILVCYFNHDTTHGWQAERFVEEYCMKNNISFKKKRLDKAKNSYMSKEEFWRNERYKFLTEQSDINKCPVITCHHLDDQVEQYLFSTLNGKERLIPKVSWGGKVIRPFLMSRKSSFYDWCERYEVPFVYDPSNEDTSYRRNFIRHELMPKALRVNPGLYTVVRKKMLKKNNE